jgi:hypothetical protein
MVNESRTFGTVVLLMLAGLAVMLWGVSLNSGLAVNTPMLAGGAILVVATALLTVGVGVLEEPETEHEADA